MSQEYATWLSNISLAESDLNSMTLQRERFSYQPKVSIVLVIEDGDEVWIKSSINSVLGQVYGNLEVCCFDNGSTRPHVTEVLREFEEDDQRVRVQRADRTIPYSNALNNLKNGADGDYMAVLSQGDELATEALFRVVEALQMDRADVIYTDEDAIDLAGERRDPRFKPAWSPTLMAATPYTGRLCLLRKDLLDILGDYEFESPEISDYDMMLRVSKSTKRIMHIPNILYHRRHLPLHETGIPHTGESHFEGDRESLHGSNHPYSNQYGELATGLLDSSQSEVSVILCGTGNLEKEWLREHLIEQASYPVKEVLSVTFEGEDSITHAINSVARKADGDHLVFLSGSASSVSEGWLRELVRAVQQSGVGAAGGKLTDTLGNIRQGGSYIEAEGLALRKEPNKPREGMYLPVIDQPYDAAAVSVECMIVSSETFGKLGGFDEENFQGALFDLDFSFRLRDAGMSVTYTPYVEVFGEKLLEKPGLKELEFIWAKRWEHVALMLFYRWSPMHEGHDALDEKTRLLLAVSDPIYRGSGS